jgi:DNA polymerase III epsilon subunit family exonuclease
MGLSLLQPLRETALAVVDVETTGASASFGHRIIEIGIVRYEIGRPVARYQQLFDPRRRISPGVSALTGITQDMVDGQPRFCDSMPQIIRLLQDAVIIGHNVRFDLSFLRKECRGTGREITEVLGEAQVMDTVRIARRRFGPGGNALQTLARRLGLAPAVAHRALADAETTGQVFEHLISPIGGWNLSLCDAILAQGGPMGLLPKHPRESLLPIELEEALERRCTVTMEYVDACGARTHRIIEPRTVRRLRGELVLVAHCHLRSQRRTFKLDRIVQFTRIEPAAPPVTPVIKQAELPYAPVNKEVTSSTVQPQLPSPDGVYLPYGPIPDPSRPQVPAD